MITESARKEFLILKDVKFLGRSVKFMWALVLTQFLITFMNIFLSSEATIINFGISIGVVLFFWCVCFYFLSTKILNQKFSPRKNFRVLFSVFGRNDIELSSSLLNKDIIIHTIEPFIVFEIIEWIDKNKIWCFHIIDEKTYMTDSKFRFLFKKDATEFILRWG